MCLINFLYNFPEDMRCFAWFGAICVLKNVKFHGGKLLKVTLLLGFSHVFKIYINGIKSRKASYIRKLEIFWF